MKLLSLALLATLSLAGTTYVTPVLTVENKTLYCYDFKRDIIKEYLPGDLVKGDYASKYCSYNVQTVENIKLQTKENCKEQSFYFEILIGLICIIAVVSAFFV